MKDIKIIMISSSGGHYEQLRMLQSLNDIFDLVWITEKTNYLEKADYLLPQTGLKDKIFPIKMIKNIVLSSYIMIKEKPDYIISTGAMVSIPMLIIGKVFKKKIIFIETFARINYGTKTGRFVYKFADLFIIQWQSLKETYPNAIYGGTIY